MTQAILNGSAVAYLISDTASVNGSVVTDGGRSFTMSDVADPTVVPAANVNVPADAQAYMCAYDGARVTAPAYAGLLAKDIATKLQGLKTYATSLAAAGTTVNGLHYDTDTDSRGLYLGAYALAQSAASPASFAWMMSSGWRQISQATVLNDIPLVGLWVQKVYANTYAHFRAIAALTTLTAVANYDFTTGWPAGT
jgi:hypothetical protein